MADQVDGTVYGHKILQNMGKYGPILEETGVHPN